ncbi:hypothetical protein JTE90_017795 [Oedothorax gibbosus]|uniref:Uncharacterized protein n=1 Tax=Oedothorax gibbosus TaxID=931172 RepID=A0AAV6U7K2_9ARAC|nr:hypothetical protein JTE90_017795 [Oedothorax gibbosus]
MPATGCKEGSMFALTAGNYATHMYFVTLDHHGNSSCVVIGVQGGRCCRCHDNERMPELVGNAFFANCP